MSAPDNSFEQPVIARFRWTADEVYQAYRYHFRHMCRPFLRRALHCLIALTLFGGIIGCFTETGRGLTVPVVFAIVGIYWFVLRPFDRPWAIRRRFAKRPDQNLEFEWQINSEKIAIVCSLAHSEIRWEAFVKVIKTPKGLMFYPINDVFHWLPRHAFASDAEFEKAAELAKAKVRQFYEVA
jgi:hypothetical protein